MSTTVPTWLTEATSLLTSAAGPANAVTAVATTLTTLAKLAEPAITDNEIQRYNDEFTAEVEKSSQLLADLEEHAWDHDARQSFGDNAAQLFADAGYPLAGGVPGDALMGVPVGFVLNALVLASAYKRAVAELTLANSKAVASTGGK